MSGPHKKPRRAVPMRETDGRRAQGTRASAAEAKPRSRTKPKRQAAGTQTEANPRAKKARPERARDAEAKPRPLVTRPGQRPDRERPANARANKDAPRVGPARLRTGERAAGPKKATERRPAERAGRSGARVTARGQGRPYLTKPRAGESKPYAGTTRSEGGGQAKKRRPGEAKPYAGATRDEGGARPHKRRTDAAKPHARDVHRDAKASSAKRGPKTRGQSPGKTKPEDRKRGQGARKALGEPRAQREFYPERPKRDAEADKAPLPERTVGPRKPVPLSQLSSKEPHPGMWIFTTREGSEQDLVDELVLAKVVDPAPRVIGPALVLSPKVPKREGRAIELTFARQGFEIIQSVRSHDLDVTTTRIARSLRNQLSEATQYALHVWVPDSTDANPLASLADELDRRIESELLRNLPNLVRVDDATLRRASVKLAQVCLLDTERAVAGVMHANRTPSLAKGGRTRVRITGDFPSRAARKLEEALAWLGVAPGPGEVCVDLGAAPGGWTYMLAERRARVIAVDPAKLRPDILARKGVRHVQESAFTFTPDEHVDWLFCDMAWRPLEAAALLAKWGRRHWARIVVANIKLPMTKKAEILARVRSILEVEGEWKHVRARQLYHDRDEITLTAVRA